MSEARIGEYYQHIKTGRLYIVVALARVEATLEKVVVYVRVDKETLQPYADNKHNTWTRPVKEFEDGRFLQVKQGGR